MLKHYNFNNNQIMYGLKDYLKIFSKKWNLLTTI
jgi:hypothetical protein